MPYHSEILKLLQSELGSSAHQLWIYLVGSSASPRPGETNDIDLLMIRPHKRKSDLIGAIEKFRKAVLAGRPEDGAFAISDGQTDALLARVVSEFERTQHIKARVSNVVGPYASMDTHENGVVLHVAGPFSRLELQYLFKRIPFHGFCFLAQHVNLCGPPLREVVSAHPHH